MKGKKIGILGSGVVGQTLANGFLKYGAEVKIGTRDFGKLKDWLSKAGTNALIGSFADAANFGEILVLAAKGNAASETLKLAGIDSLNGKTIIDTTNPIGEESPQNGVLKFFTTYNESLMEQFQKQVPKANFVKCFNSVGNGLMVNPHFKDGKPSMFICGNDEFAKNQIKEILNLFGWEIEDMGKAEAARAIEPLCILWCIPGFLSQSWTHAFKLLK
ncbi:NAD(P)-binding domain-containing protein [Leptospira borgpetersenii serovar Hardjo-bovis]|uniref:NADP oxidoreductase coenzyme F420-dependent n=1 Tax=Leptospira borgpetersenii serovar Hardjo-bovis str. Sponselee TaxID=1303729 RepID=M6BEX9_LEPBO|nr:NAD(P)-binding domain-containing protein [Leptospira borgpetersenii]ABJ80397.1 Dinucleotide-binding enzyme [Leptospira borgpetersenii serovar Hardjo-bovis str. L550]AMX59840.1 DNA-binding protein [Leptospira borgpetersenii serovar Hardjo]AMX63069.1 DNA-binding protein [Leptospira borgpetersenii serovar Hardjo]AMX66312.1 DNA-binding protein [Leptospira borgpetersenii serovar Hardjo]AMX69544.1 DNA-binding protein [Leptospira borgpetersenii serovar Hardjo]